MSDQPPEENQKLLFIADTVESMRDRMDEVSERMATKDDIARLERKIEVEITAVRGDIEQVHLRLDSIERAL